jgi:hypothetical protein
MQISKPVKIIIGLFTAWIILSPFLFLGAWLIFVISLAVTPGQSQPNPNVLAWLILPGIFLIICTSILHLGLQAFYLVHIILNNAGVEVVRVILGLGMILLPYLAMPVYYFIYILPDRPPAWALGTNAEQNVSTHPIDTPSSSANP